ncbi:MAG: LytTR family transcriptional regulator DNA-binding domain-containing protein [Acidobacteriota bacterium]
MNRLDRILLHLSDFRRVPVDPADVYYLDAAGDETLVRTRSSRLLRDVRSLGELFPAFKPFGFVRAHRNHAVNLRRIREIRRRKRSEDWELKLQPPVNRVLPVSRGQLSKLLAAFGETRRRSR